MTFPAGFRWGVATSAYQIEGATAEGGREPSDWDEFASRPGVINRGDTADIAADHYHRYIQDLDLMSELGVDTYRFSISWTRVIPDGSGPVNPEGIGFYSRLVDELLKRSITPLVTINHMELPLTLARQGGWLNRDTIDRYADFATVIHDALRNRVSLWSTLNEVALMTWWGHGTPWFPPALDDKASVMPAIHHQMVAHGRAVTRLRQAQPDGVFGIVGSQSPVAAAASGQDHADAARLLDLMFNRSCLDVLVDGAYPAELLDWHQRIGGQPFIHDGDLEDAAAQLDYYGLNYYAPLQVLADPAGPGGEAVPPGIGLRQVVPPEAPKTAFNWVIDAGALLPVLRQFRDRYQLPVYITENGGAFDDYVAPTGRINDTDRIDYLSNHLNVIATAISEGADVRGYMAWSLLDNFEWAAGYSKRFGLAYVDYGTQRRIPKESFHWYRAFIEQSRAQAAEAGRPDGA
jgi:beta-glucosidase